MRKITIMALGNLKEKYLTDAIQEYTKRTSRFFDLKIIQIDESKIVKNSEANILKALDDEAAKIISLSQNKIICPLTIEGNQLNSVQLADFIKNQTDKGELCFVIGSSYGLSEKIKKLGQNISFGKITLPHQLMRVVLCEQIYRAGTIINNIEYHK